MMAPLAVLFSTSVAEGLRKEAVLVMDEKLPTDTDERRSLLLFLSGCLTLIEDVIGTEYRAAAQNTTECRMQSVISRWGRRKHGM